MQLNQSLRQGAEKPKKRMLEVEKLADGRTKVAINSSSLDLIQTCMRKSHYVLERQLVSNSESEALTFGSAIHKALEIWYAASALHRRSETLQAAAIAGFESIGSSLRMLDTNDKRSIDNGIKILRAYFKHYADDGFEVALDESGSPLVEKNISFLLHHSEELVIEYFGTIDVILQNKATGVTVICDHKTTHQLGSEFYNRCKPNFQYCGYVRAAREALGIDTRLFMINGIQVVKTKQEFARQIVEFDASDFQEHTDAVVAAVKRYLHAQETAVWPMTAPNPCASYGGCQFLKVCEVPTKLRENVLSALYGVKI